MMQRYAILAEDGTLARIVGCPAGEIEAQLVPGETYRNARKADTLAIERIQRGKAPTKAELLAQDVARVNEAAAAKIEKAFPLYAQVNALREGNQDDPRFADVDAIRAWANTITEALQQGQSIDAFDLGGE